MHRLRELAERTPPQRDRYVDLLRAAAITLVVVGHWSVIVISYDDGELVGSNALAELSWSRPLTWLFQVMPVFFIVGGFANAASLRAYRRRGGDAVGWLLVRSGRLVPPTTVFLVTLCGAALLARLFGLDTEHIATAVWLASIPLWFLAIYVAVVFGTPVMLWLQQRAGIAVVVFLIGLVAIGDVARLRYDMGSVAYGNYLFAWFAIHQMGFAWRDGLLAPRPRVGVLLLCGGFSALLVLTLVGPYPISMVNVPGATVQNASPPTLALLALAATQLGLSLLFHDLGQRWLQRIRPWTVVIAANSVVLTIFLWHMSAVIVTTVALHLAGWLPTPSVHSLGWLLWRIPWLLLLGVALTGLVLFFGRIETQPRDRRIIHDQLPGFLIRTLAQAQPRVLATLLGYGTILFGLHVIGLAGRTDHGVFGLPVLSLLSFLIGAAILNSARSSLTKNANLSSPKSAAS